MLRKLIMALLLLSILLVRGFTEDELHIPTTSIALQSCIEAKAAFQAYPFYYQTLSELSPIPAPSENFEFWTVDIDGVTLLIPGAAYQRYKLFKSGEFSRISFYADEDIVLAISISKSADVVSRATVQSDQAVSISTGVDFSIKTIFDFTPDDISCSESSWARDRMLIDLMRLKGSAAPPPDSDGELKIGAIDRGQRYGYLIRSSSAAKGTIRWYSEFVDKDKYVVWLFQFPITLARKYGDVGLMMLDEVDYDSPPWWESLHHRLEDTCRANEGVDQEGALQ